MNSRFIWVLLPFLFCDSLVAASIEIDQVSFGGGLQGATITTNHIMAQTFTVGKAGTLAAVEAVITKGSLVSNDLTLSIWSTNATGYRENLLGTSIMPESEIVDSIFINDDSLLYFDVLGSGILVSEGDVLAISFSSGIVGSSSLETQYVWWNNRNSHSDLILPPDYVGGEARRCYTDLVPEACDATPRVYDQLFRTQVQVVPLPAAVWLFGSALVGLGWMRRKKA